MPLDGCYLKGIANELAVLIDSHIEKIHIPAKNEFVLTLKGPNGAHRLYISINPDRPRVNLTEQTFENPEKPPMFCMLLRKHIGSGRIINIETVGCERLLRFYIQSTNELGDRVTLQLITELIGRSANLILVGQNGRIIDAAKRSDLEKCERVIQPGAEYTLPPTQKADILLPDTTAVLNAVSAQKEKPLADVLLQNIAGISPLVCREIAHRCKEADVLCGEVDRNILQKTLTFVQAQIAKEKPYVLLQPNGTPKDFCFLPITQYGSLYKQTVLGNYNQTLDYFYGELDRKRRIERTAADLLKLTKNLITRTDKKLALRQKELAATKDKEMLRIQGELLKANLYRVPRGAENITVENYYDQSGKEITIILDPALSPAANAAKYFKEYKKACSAEQLLGGLIKDCLEQKDYLSSVLFSLQQADNVATLNQIRTELQQSGYLPTPRNNKKNMKPTVKPMQFEVDGFTVLVGRNNLQNDALTLKTASKNDLWFHTKNIHGCHAVLLCGEQPVPDEVLLKVAQIAAYYSKARESSNVPVDYTKIKNVKKPAGAKAGMVIYSANKTLFVTPKIP